jgi:hypothetical protein
MSKNTQPARGKASAYPNKYQKTGPLSVNCLLSSKSYDTESIKLAGFMVRNTSAYPNKYQKTEPLTVNCPPFSKLYVADFR